jgi:hypothetical protein
MKHFLEDTRLDLNLGHASDGDLIKSLPMISEFEEDKEREE